MRHCAASHYKHASVPLWPWQCGLRAYRYACLCVSECVCVCVLLSYVICRANGLLGGSPKPITPTQLDSLLAAAAQSPCQTVQKPRGPGLQRRSIGDIDWGTGTDSTHSPARTQHQEPHRQAHRDKPQSGHKGLSASVADPGVHQQLESLRLTE